MIRSNQRGLPLIVMALVLLCAVNAFAITYTYDPLNRLTQVAYDNGTSIGYTYDAAGNIVQIAKAGGAAVNGVCGSSNGAYTTIIPTTNLCDAGSVTTVSGSGPWNWTCTGSNGGTDANCMASNQSFIVTFTSGGNGTLTGTVNQTINYNGNTTTVIAVPDSGYHFVNWTEGATVVGTTAALTTTNITSAHSYTANFAVGTSPPVNGTCGSSNSQTFSVAPTTNLCTAGTASTLTPTTTGWTWTCQGTDGGTTADCSANVSIQINIKTGWNLLGWTTRQGYYEGTTAPQVSEMASSAIMNSIGSTMMSSVFTAMGLTSSSLFVVVGPNGVVYMPGSPFNTLKNALPGKGYWIYTGSDKSITVPGRALSAPDQLPLNAGWTQIGYWGTDSAAPATGFTCINGLYDIVVDESGKVYMSGSPFNTLTSLQKNKGYFIHTTAPATLTYQCP